MKLINYFKSINFAILLCMMAMTAQGYHTFYTFSKMSDIQGIAGIIQSLLFVFTFELFTLFYLVRGRKPMAAFYAICYAIINLYYYFSHLSGGKLYVATFLSFIIPFSIYFVAEEIAKQEGNAIKEVNDGINEPKFEIATHEDLLAMEKKLSGEINALKSNSIIAGRPIIKKSDERNAE